jgi:hypothetical protein
MENTMLDASGNGNNLTATGSPAYVAGKLGRGVRLNDTATLQFLSLATPFAFEIGSTFCAWINFERVTTNSEYFLGRSDASLVGVRYNSTNFLINDSVTPFNATFNWTKVSGFVHFTLIRSAATAYQIFINGASIGTANTTSATNITFSAIGRRGTMDVPPAKIDIDEAAFFNAALDANDIRRVMNGQMPQRRYA